MGQRCRHHNLGTCTPQRGCSRCCRGLCPAPMRMSGWPGWPPRATPSTHAGVAHIGALCQAVDLTHVGTIHDPWAGQGMHNVQEVLSYDQGMHVLTNGARMGQAARLHPLHPRTYDTMGTCDAIITCPWGEWADVALPMAILYARMVACHARHACTAEIIYE